MMGNTFYMDWEITLITWMQQSLGSIGQVLSKVFSFIGG